MDSSAFRLLKISAYEFFSGFDLERLCPGKALGIFYFRTQFSDLCYGYNAFWRRNLDCLDLPCTDLPEPQWGDGFEIETVINVRAAKSGWLIREVGSFEGKRLHGNSNLNAVTDGMRVLRTIGREHRERVGGARVPAGAGWSP